MSDEEYSYDLDGDVTLDVDEKNVGGSKSDWLKLTAKGQMLRAAFVYFHTYDHNAVAKATKEAKSTSKSLTREEIQAVAKQALADRAAELNKTVDQLTPTDKLDLRLAHFKAMKAHYQDGFGFALSRLGKDGPEADLVWKKLPEPKPYFSTLLLIYPTDESGTMNKEAFIAQAKAGTLKLIPWRFGNKTYEEIWKLNDGLRENTLSLGSQDIKLECKDPKYQNISVSFAGAALWQKNDSIRQQVLAKALGMYTSGEKLMPFREMTTEQLRVKLGMGGSGGSAVQDVTSDDFAGMLENV